MTQWWLNLFFSVSCARFSKELLEKSAFLMFSYIVQNRAALGELFHLSFEYCNE